MARAQKQPETTALVHPEIEAARLAAEVRADYGDGTVFDAMRVAKLIGYHQSKLVESAVLVGRYLTWAKAEMSHGQFMRWFDDCVEGGIFHFHLRQAQRYMLAARAANELGIKKLDQWSVRRLTAALDTPDKEAAAALGERLPAPGKDRSPYDGMTADQLREELRIRDRKLERGEEQLNAAHAKIRDLEARYPKDPFLARAKQLEVLVTTLGSIPCPDEIRSDAGLIVLAPIYEALERLRRRLQGDADPE